MLGAYIWNHFTSAFSAAIQGCPEHRLASVWSTSKARTQFYRDMLTPLAKNLGAAIEDTFEAGNELFKVDFAICRNSEGVSVPVIFIESENVPDSAHHEVRKLVNLAAPLRVLITVAPWDQESGVWDGKGGGHKNRLLEAWERIMVQHQTIWPRSGVVGILVGEWRPDKKFRFYAYG